MKRILSRVFANWIDRKTHSDQKHAVQRQKDLLRNLINDASETSFGKDHNFKQIRNYDEFVKQVPVRDYESLRSYFDRVKNGEADILWKGKPIYISKTSGTTTGAKYIPITQESISNHLDSARNALLAYIHETGRTAFVSGKMIFLQGSPELDEINGIRTGRLSGIVAHHVPKYLQSNRMPGFKINCIEDWEEKLEGIVEETLQVDMRLISGIPPWVQMYFEQLIEKSGKENIAEIFPDFSLLVYGGVNYKPYQNRIRKLIGKDVDSIEVYPASEGFIAYQDSQKEKGMLLNVNSGIFFEFIKMEDISKENPIRISLEGVELNTNYALVLSNNAGLWSYKIGDTIKFVSKNPYRIVVTGRTKHFTSAFGEHVIGEEVEDAISHLSSRLNIDISEFHVAPVTEPSEGQLPHHEWLIEFNTNDVDLEKCAEILDGYMQQRNPYYFDLREGNILEQLHITTIREHGFNNYMKSVGKLGGQNKLPRLSNDRSVADKMHEFRI